MKISHKRNIQRKLHKHNPLFINTVSAVKKVLEVKATVETIIEIPVVVSKSVVVLTPKQQQVLDIVISNIDGLNPKGIGLQAGQDDAKAAAWATGALKKLTEEGLVERIQLAGNKVLYKAL